jgi:hypothetical protein
MTMPARTRWLILGLLLFPACASAEQVTVTFREIDDLFANPGKGWMTQQRLPGNREPRLPAPPAPASPARAQP